MTKKRKYTRKVRPLIIEADHAKVDLLNGVYVKIDLHWVDQIGLYNWSYNRRYAVRKCITCESAHSIFMHVVINNTPDGMCTDHIDRNTLDNREANLRTANYFQNSINSPPKANTTSKFKGVSWDSEKKKWAPRIEINGVQKRLGRYHNEEDAARAYDKAAIAAHGTEFTYLNFP